MVNTNTFLSCIAKSLAYAQKQPATLAFVLYLAGLILPCVKGPDGNTYTGLGMTLAVMREAWIGFIMLLFAHGAVINGLARVRQLLPSTPATNRYALAAVGLCCALAIYWWVKFPWSLYVGFYGWLASIMMLAFALWGPLQPKTTGVDEASEQNPWLALKKPVPMALAVCLLALPLIRVAVTGWGGAAESSDTRIASSDSSSASASDADSSLSLLRPSGDDDPDGSKRVARLRAVADGTIAADGFVRGRAIALLRSIDNAASANSESVADSSTSFSGVSPNRRVFSDDEWGAIIASLVREGRVRRTRPQDASKYFGIYAAIKGVFVDSGIDSPTVRMLNGFKEQVCEATITARGPEAAAKQLAELVLAAKQSGNPLVSAESAAQFEAGLVTAAGKQADGLTPSQQASGYAPQTTPEFEGTCAKCGYRTGRQVNQSQRTCSQLGVGVDGTRPCGGVIIWAQAGGVSPLQAGGSTLTNRQQYEGQCTKCGYRTGRQVSQSQRTCSQLGVGPDGTRPCGGVIAWAPAGAMPGAVPGTAGPMSSRQIGSGYTPPRMQQFEGQCSRCGYRTGRQVNQSQRTCSQLGVGVDGTRPCGGVIVWGPAQGF
jgi:hypothetical protein